MLKAQLYYLHCIYCPQFFKPILYCLFVLFPFLTSTSEIRLSSGRVLRPKTANFQCSHTGKEQGNHNFCLSRSHYTDIDPTSREQAPGAGIEPPDQESHALRLELPNPSRRAGKGARRQRDPDVEKGRKNDGGGGGGGREREREREKGFKAWDLLIKKKGGNLHIWSCRGGINSIIR